MDRSLRPQRRNRTRTCVGCGKSDSIASGLVRLVVHAGGVEFDLPSRSRGRGAYVHARPTCLARAPRGLPKALRLAPAAGRGSARGLAANDLASALSVACVRRMGELLRAARRLRAIRADQPHRVEAAEGRPEALTIVAVDAGHAASSSALGRAVAGGRAFAWGTRSELGALLGISEVASCSIDHESLAAELSRTRAVAAAASLAIQEAMQRTRPPEAR